MGPAEVKAAIIADPADFAAWLLEHAAELDPASLVSIPKLKDGRTAAIVYIEEREAEEFAEDTVVT